MRRIQDDWTKGDTNADGKLSLEEYLKSPMGKYAETMAPVDPMHCCRVVSDAYYHIILF